MGYRKVGLFCCSIVLQRVGTTGTGAGNCMHSRAFPTISAHLTRPLEPSARDCTLVRTVACARMLISGSMRPAAERNARSPHLSRLP